MSFTSMFSIRLNGVVYEMVGAVLPACFVFLFTDFDYVWYGSSTLEFRSVAVVACFEDMIMVFAWRVWRNYKNFT